MLGDRGKRAPQALGSMSFGYLSHVTDASFSEVVTDPHGEAKVQAPQARAIAVARPSGLSVAIEWPAMGTTSTSIPWAGSCV